MWYRIYDLDGVICGYIWTQNIELGMKRARIAAREHDIMLGRMGQKWQSIMNRGV